MISPPPSVSLMDPMMPADEGHRLEDTATDLVAAASRLAGRLHPLVRARVGDLVRSMNCYYSNLIEGHDTLPVDIDRALAGEYDREPARRDLQLEARAHIEVQALIDRGETPTPVLSVEFIRWVHRAFCERLPEALLQLADPVTGERRTVVPGAFRQDHVKAACTSRRHRPTCRGSSTVSSRPTMRAACRGCGG